MMISYNSSFLHLLQTHPISNLYIQNIMAFCELEIMLLLLVLSLLLPHAQQQEIPQTLGLHIFTSRSKEFFLFRKYIEAYASMNCSLITEINIVWDSRETLKLAGMPTASANWKIPVNIYTTPSNSRVSYYKLANGSKALVYFSIDNDLLISCEQLTKGFKVWQANAVGSIAPIVSYQTRYFEYKSELGLAIKQDQSEFFNLASIGSSFISRHLMQLYYAEVWELQEVRKIVQQKGTCEDIALAWISQYFYPEFQAVAIKGQFTQKASNLDSQAAKVYSGKRDSCLNLFTYIFESTLKYKPLTNKYPQNNKSVFPFRNSSILLKKEYLQRRVIQKEKHTNQTQPYLIPYTREKIDQILTEYQQQLSGNQIIIQKLTNQLAQLQSSANTYNKIIEQYVQTHTQLLSQKAELQKQILDHKQELLRIVGQITKIPIGIALDTVGNSASSFTKPKSLKYQIILYGLVSLIAITAVMLIRELTTNRRQHAHEQFQSQNAHGDMPDPTEFIDQADQNH